MSFQKPFQRFLNGLLLLFDIAAQTGERHAGVVRHRAIGQNFAFEILEQRAKFAQRLPARAQAWKSSGHRVQNGFCVGGAIQQARDVENFARLERRAFDAQLVNRFRQIRNGCEIQANGCATGRGLRLCRRSQILRSFGSFFQVLHQARAFSMRRDCSQIFPAEWARDIPLQQLSQSFEFENVGASRDHHRDLSRNAFSITGSVPSVMRYCVSALRGTHSARATSSEAASFPPARPAQIIDQHVVILRITSLVAHDALEDFDNLDDPNLEPRLLAHFAADSLFQPLARFHHATRYRPIAFQRLAPALHQQHAIPVQDDRAHAENRALGILAAISAGSCLNTAPRLSR